MKGTLSVFGWQTAQTLHMWSMLALHLFLLLGLRPLFLLTLTVDHTMDAHTLIAVRALACPKTH